MAKASFMRRSAREVKNYTVMIKAASVICACLVAVTAVAYLVSYLYDKYDSFTVSVNKYDMVKQGLTLSETPDFTSPISRLNAKAVKDITNISGDRLPKDIDKINGSHNGDYYIAYTFYLKNMGEDTVTYDYSINIENVTNSVDKAIRIRVYQNGEPTTYARTRSDGTGPERDTKEFASSNIAVKNQKRDFKQNDVDKYTVAIWLEGDDPDCVDDIIGGKMKLAMDFNIVEDQETVM